LAKTNTTPTRARGSAVQRIQECFSRQVAQLGYDRATFSDIALELGLSKGTIVHHFGNKEELLRVSFEDYMTRRLEEARTIRDGGGPAEVRLARFLYTAILCHRDDRASTLTFIRCWPDFRDHEAMTAVRVMRDEYAQHLRDILADVARSQNRASGDTTVQSLYIFGMCNWMWTWYRPDGDRSVSEIARILIAMSLGALGWDVPGDDELDALIATAASGAVLRLNEI
jgi:AcrR family transcriptional regulator